MYGMTGFWRLLKSTSERKGLTDISLPMIFPPCCLVAWHFDCCLSIFETPRPLPMMFAKLAHCTNHQSVVRGAGKKLRSEAHTHTQRGCAQACSQCRHAETIGSRVTNRCDRPVNGSIPTTPFLACDWICVPRMMHSEESPMANLLTVCSSISLEQTIRAANESCQDDSFSHLREVFGFVNFMGHFKNSTYMYISAWWFGTFCCFSIYWD